MMRHGNAAGPIVKAAREEKWEAEMEKEGEGTGGGEGGVEREGEGDKQGERIRAETWM